MVRGWLVSCSFLHLYFLYHTRFSKLFTLYEKSRGAYSLILHFTFICSLTKKGKSIKTYTMWHLSSVGASLLYFVVLARILLTSIHTSKPGFVLCVCCNPISYKLKAECFIKNFCFSLSNELIFPWRPTLQLVLLVIMHLILHYVLIGAINSLIVNRHFTTRLDAGPFKPTKYSLVVIDENNINNFGSLACISWIHGIFYYLLPGCIQCVFRIEWNRKL